MCQTWTCLANSDHDHDGDGDGDSQTFSKRIMKVNEKTALISKDVILVPYRKEHVEVSLHLFRHSM